MKKYPLLILAFLVCFLLVTPCWADTLKIGECTSCDSSTTPDNVLFEFLDSEHTNFGASGNWNTGWLTIATTEFRSIIKFPLDQGVLTDATITAATFGCYVESVSGGGGNPTIEIHAISAANEGWIEGTKDNATAGAGEPDWVHFSHTSPTTTWAGSAGLSTDTTDYVSASYGSFNGTSTGAKTAILSGAAITYLNGKIGSDAEFLIFADSFADTEYSTMSSAEDGTAANRPYLELTYTPATPTGAPQVIIILF